MRQTSVRFIIELAAVLIVNSNRAIGAKSEVRLFVSTAIVSPNGHVEMPVARHSNSLSSVVFNDDIQNRAIAYLS